jgi:hypothetical protein
MMILRQSLTDSRKNRRAWTYRRLRAASHPIAEVHTRLDPCQQAASPQVKHLQKLCQPWPNSLVCVGSFQGRRSWLKLSWTSPAVGVKIRYKDPAAVSLDRGEGKAPFNFNSGYWTENPCAGGSISPWATMKGTRDPRPIIGGFSFSGAARSAALGAALRFPTVPPPGSSGPSHRTPPPSDAPRTWRKSSRSSCRAGGRGCPFL